MAYERRGFAGAAVATTLNGSITNAATTVVITASTGWPDGAAGDFFVVIDRGTASEEKVLIDSRSGTTLTVATGGRGSDGTSATSHSSGAAIEVCGTARDFDEANYTTSETVGKITTSQDLLVADGANSLTRLGVGSSGQLLQVSSGTVAWGALPDGAVSTAAKIADGTVESSKIAANAVSTTKIPDSAITTTKIQDAAVTAAKVAAAVAGDGLTGGAGSALAVNVDDSTVAISADQVIVKSAGVTATQLASSAVTTDKIASLSVTNAKLASEAWSSYTASIGGTGWSIGDGTISARWVKMNRLVVASIRIVFGSTSGFGSAALTITLPATASAKQQRGVAYLRDEGGGFDWLGGWEIGVWDTVATFKAQSTGSTETIGRLQELIDTRPFTWASSDSVTATIVYEADS